MKSNYIPVVFSFTENYFIPVSVSIQSILENSRLDSQFEFICLVDIEFTDDKKEKLSLLVKDRGKVTFINLSESLLNGIDVNKRYSTFAYYRLLLPNLLSSYDKVIYLDSDLVINTDLSNLYYDYDLSGYYLGAVFEPTLPEQGRHLSVLGIHSNEYFNSGVLFMNLELMRNIGLVNEFTILLKSKNLIFPDQDVLNLACRGKILALPPRYNSIRTFFIDKYKNHFLTLYSEEDWKSIKENSIIHYTGRGIKPWEKYCVNFNYWWKYYDILPEYIKETWSLNKKLYYIYLIGDTALGKSFVWILKKIKSLLNEGN